jgi:phosphoserine phosphatase
MMSVAFLIVGFLLRLAVEIAFEAVKSFAAEVMMAPALRIALEWLRQRVGLLIRLALEVVFEALKKFVAELLAPGFRIAWKWVSRRGQ